MTAMVVVVLHEALDAGFEITGYEAALQQDPVLERLVPASPLAGRRLRSTTPRGNLPVRLPMVRCPADVNHAVVAAPFREISGYVTSSVIGKQPWSMSNSNFIGAQSFQRQFERVSDVGRLHCRAQLPSDDISRLSVVRVFGTSCGLN
jgi:hypothetical protein